MTAKKDKNKSYAEINREIVTKWQKSTDEKARGEILYAFIQTNFKFFLFPFPDEWLTAQLFIELHKLFPKIDPSGHIITFIKRSISHDIAKAWRYEESVGLAVPRWAKPDQLDVYSKLDFLSYVERDEDEDDIGGDIGGD